MKILIKLLLSSLSILVFFSDVSLATEQRCENKNNSFYVDEKSDIYKCVSYNVDIQIRTASDLYGKDYWALKAITDKTDPFYTSIKALKQIIASTEEFVIASSKRRAGSISKECISPQTWFDNYSAEKSNFSFAEYILDLEKDEPMSRTLNDPCIKNIFARINFISVLFGCHFSCIANNHDNLGQVWDASMRKVREELGFAQLSTGISLYKYLLSKFDNNKKKLEAFIKHDWLCYMNQFNILNYYHMARMIYADTKIFPIYIDDDGALTRFSLLWAAQLELFGKSSLQISRNEIDFFNLKKTAECACKGFKNKGELLDNFYKKIQFAKKFVDRYNSLLQKYKLYKDIYKINTSDYDFDYIFILTKLKDLSTFDSSKLNEYVMYADGSISLTKKFIDDKNSLPLEYKRYINPKVFLKIFFDLRYDLTSNEAYTKVTGILYHLFKMFADLRLVKLNLNLIEEMVTNLMGNKNKKTVQEFTPYVERLVKSPKQRDLEELYTKISPFFGGE